MAVNNKVVITEAKQQFRDNKLDVAFALMNGVYDRMADNAAFLQDLAECSFRLKEYEASEKAAEKLLEIDGAKPYWRILLARTLVSNGNPERAKELLLSVTGNRESEGLALRWLLEVGKVLKDAALEKETAERIVQLHNAGQKLPANALDRAHAALGRVGSEASLSGSISTDVEFNGVIEHKQFGIKIPDTNILSDRIRNSFRTGTYEHWEGEAAVRLIKGGERILELGGGLGFVSSVVGVKAAKVESYHIIEADPRLKAVIEKTHELNGVKGFTVETCMVSAVPEEIEKGSAQFALAGNFTASSAKRLNVGRREISVPVVSFDAMMEAHKPNILICDIEGSELDLVENADLTPFRAVMMEIHPDVFGSDGVARIFKRFGDIGFAYDTTMSSGSVVTFQKRA